MKTMKRLMAVVVFALALSFMLADCTSVEAAVPKRQAGVIYVNPQSDGWGDIVWKSFTKLRMGINNDASFNVYFGREGDYITDVKVNKKSGLIAGVTYQNNSYYDADYDWSSYGTIGLVSSKSGTYTVSFTVRKADGSVAGNYKVKVYAYPTGTVKTAKLGSKTVYSSTIKQKGTTFTTTSKSSWKVANSLKSAKLKLTPNKGYKITGLTYVYYNEKGKPVVKTVKNGKTIKLSQQYSYRNYDSEGNYFKASKMYTNVYVSYKDTYLGTSVKYSVVKRHNTKMIRMASTSTAGEVTYSYYELDDNYGYFTFWRY